MWVTQMPCRTEETFMMLLDLYISLAMERHLTLNYPRYDVSPRQSWVTPIRGGGDIQIGYIDLTHFTTILHRLILYELISRKESSYLIGN